MPSVGEPGYVPYCGRCTGLQRMKRGATAFECPSCGLHTRRVNGEDIFDQTAPRTSGDIPIKDKLVFRWMIQGDRTPEIYAWLEDDHAIVSKTGGFWRTVDPEEALRRCKANFPEHFEETVND